MTGEVAKGAATPVALRRLHEISNSRLEIMTLIYDLDGALGAGQIGMARHTAVSLLDASVTLWLRERGIAVPEFAHAPVRGRVAFRRLGAVNADLADRVSRISTAEVPAEAGPVAEHCREVLGLVGELTGYEAGSLTASVSGWVDTAKAVRATCVRLGMPLNDFYWPPPDAESWYSDVLRFVSSEGSHDDADHV
jgi:hypothetical protein